jgi:lipoprotein
MNKRMIVFISTLGSCYFCILIPIIIGAIFIIFLDILNGQLGIDTIIDIFSFFKDPWVYKIILIGVPFISIVMAMLNTD